MTWLVTGTWDFDGKSGSVKVEAPSMRGALDAAKAQGLNGSEAIMAGSSGGGSAGRPATGGKVRRMGLSKGEAWAVIIVGLLLSPVVVGIPMIVWGVLSLRQLSEA